MKHQFYKKYDDDVPASLRDRNGDICLAQCKICKCTESSLPTDCPGTVVSSDIQDLISKGKIDFIKGSWTKDIIKLFNQNVGIQTKNGNPVVIYEVYLEKGIVHGAWFENGSQPIIASWDLTGKKLESPYSQLDLVLSDWKEEIPWCCLNKHIRWVARDKDGSWFGYINKPYLSENEWKIDKDSDCFELNCLEMPNGPSDWKKAIIERP